MKIKDLITVMMKDDVVKIITFKDDGGHTLYKGEVSEIPKHLMHLEINWIAPDYRTECTLIRIRG